MITRKRVLPIKIDAARCAGCLTCELRCSLRFLKAFSIARAAIEIRRNVHSADEYRISFTDRCDSCGICVRYCGYGALTVGESGDI